MYIVNQWKNKSRENVPFYFVEDDLIQEDKLLKA